MQYAEITNALQAAVAPVVILGAEGVVGAVIQQRYQMIFDRIRLMNAERLHLEQTRRDGARWEGSLAAARGRDLRNLLDLLQARGRLTRLALQAHFASLCFLVLCTAVLTVNALYTPPDWLLALPLIFFLAGIATFLAAGLFAFLELQQAVGLSVAETAMIDAYEVFPLMPGDGNTESTSPGNPAVR